MPYCCLRMAASTRRTIGRHLSTTRRTASIHIPVKSGARLLAVDQAIASPETGLHYRIERFLGKGGFGEVYLARRLGRSASVPETVCIKVSSSIDGWLREAYFGKLLDGHPRAIGVYDMFPRLRERRTQRAKTLSGGEQQMLAIGRGLMTNPDCLIMDEPSEGLAPIIIQGVWEAIAKLKKEGMSILLVEQNASLALKLVDYVHVMSKGQVVYSARPEELWANEQIKHSYLGI